MEKDKMLLSWQRIDTHFVKESVAKTLALFKWKSNSFDSENWNMEKVLQMATIFLLF